MLYRVLAEAVALLHLAFVLFVAVGGLLVLRWPRIVWLHMACAAWGAVIVFTDVVCPLTPLEKALRVSAGGVAYEGGFIRHYLVSPVFPAGVPTELGAGLVVLALLGNGWVYWKLARSWRAGRNSPAPDAAVPPRRA